MAYGDRVGKDGRLVNALKVRLQTPEEYSGKKLTDMTLAEVLKFQRYRNSTSNSTGAVGKYQFMQQTLFGKDGKGGLVKDLNLDMNQKFTPQVQEMLQKRLYDRNVASLTNQGIDATPGNIAMAQYIGAAGSGAVYKAIKSGEGNLTVQQAIVKHLGQGYDPVRVGAGGQLINKELGELKSGDFPRIMAEREARGRRKDANMPAAPAAKPSEVPPSPRQPGMQVSESTWLAMQAKDEMNYNRNSTLTKRLLGGMWGNMNKGATQKSPMGTPAPALAGAGVVDTDFMKLLLDKQWGTPHK